MSRLYFIRHGQASFGADNYDRLSEKGGAQAHLLARHLKKREITFDLTMSGSLERQKRTREIFYKEAGKTPPEHLVMPGLNEYDSRAIMTALTPVIIEEKPELQKDAGALLSSRKSFQRVFEEVMLRWIKGHHGPEVESFQHFKTRVHGVIDTLMADHGRGKTIGVFTSGGPIATTVGRALNISGEEIMRINWQIANTSFSRFRCTKSRFSLQSFNEFGHLEEAGSDYITYR